jgi:hypothetical protein
MTTANIKIANVYNTILEEVRKTLVVTRKDGEIFVGALFFPHEKDDIIMDTIEEVTMKGTAEEIVNMCCYLKWRNGLLAKDGKTLQTMEWWQYCNGFTNELI